MKPILFPNLGLSLNIDPVAFSIFGKDIYWYGLIITVGIAIALFLVWKNRENQKIKWDDITDFVLYAIPIGIICARLYYVIFNWDYYGNNLIDIFKIWNGGLAIYGGIIGGIITAFVFCKRRKISFLDLCDYCAPYLAFCQSVGRWGNFVNREAYGQITNSFLKMGIFNEATKEYIFVQPTFLYESICTFIIFIILLRINKSKKFSGQSFYIYMILYGIARACIEGLRSDSLYIGTIRVSQALSLLFSTIFAIIYILAAKKSKKSVE